MLFELGDEAAVNGFAVGLDLLVEGADEGVGENLFGFELPAGHVEGKRKDAMAMAFKGIATFLRGRSLSKVNDERSFFWIKSAQWSHLGGVSR